MYQFCTVQCFKVPNNKGNVISCINNIQNQLMVQNEIRAYHKVYKLGINLPIL